MSRTNAYLLGKFKDRRGESLIETLVAILIAVLSLGLLATAIAASTHMTSGSADTMRKYHNANSAVADHNEASKVSGQGTLVFKEGTKTKYLTADHTDIKVGYYANNESGSVPVVAYERIK